MIGRNRVVVTGIGVLAANGIGKDAFWNSLLAGQSGIGPITQFDASELPCQIAGEISDFDPLDFIEASLKPRRMARFSQLSLSAALLAIEDAGLSVSALKLRPSLSVILGVSTSDFDTILEAPKAYSTSALIPHASAATVAATLGLNCEMVTLSNACTSGLDAIAHGADLIRKNKADMVLAGGSDSSITKKAMEFLCRGNMLPTSMNACGERASRPFDLRREGGILAEGSGVMVLESEESALERGSHIYAEVLGSGSRTDYTSKGNVSALSTAMTMALLNSNICHEQIQYINAHAPSDPYVDYMETMAIKAAFNNHAYKLAVSSIKGSTGNPLGAGGSLQCIATALSIEHKCLPPTANYETSDPDCDLDYVSRIARNLDVECAMVNSRGVSGNTSSMIFKAYS